MGDARNTDVCSWCCRMLQEKKNVGLFFGALHMWPVGQKGLKNQAKECHSTCFQRRTLARGWRYNVQDGWAAEALSLQSAWCSHPNTYILQRWMAWKVQKGKGILRLGLTPPWTVTAARSAYGRLPWAGGILPKIILPPWRSERTGSNVIKIQG